MCAGAGGEKYCLGTISRPRTPVTFEPLRPPSLPPEPSKAPPFLRAAGRKVKAGHL